MKILLVCSAGTSTSLVVQKMQKVAVERGLKVDIEAVSSMAAKANGGEFDVLLLGPQMRFELKSFEELYSQKPVEVINTIDYGRLNGEAILDRALELAGK